MTTHEITSTRCPLCRAVITPVQVRVTAKSITAWYRCPNTSCYFLPVRVDFTPSKEVLATLCQSMPGQRTAR